MGACQPGVKAAKQLMVGQVSQDGTGNVLSVLVIACKQSLFNHPKDVPDHVSLRGKYDTRSYLHFLAAKL